MRDLSRLANLFICLPGVGVPAALDSTIVFALPFSIDAAVIVLAARDGAFRYARIERRQLFGTLGVCRLLRFGVEAALGVMYSKRALSWLESAAVQPVVLAVLSQALIVRMVSAIRWMKLPSLLLFFHVRQQDDDVKSAALYAIEERLLDA